MPTQCTIVENRKRCHKKHCARGMCRMHYMRWRRYGDPLVHAFQSAGQCSIRGCHETHFGLGYCHRHYENHRQRGGATFDPLTVDERFDARINREDLDPCWVYGNSGKAEGIMVDGVRMTAVRFAYERWVGWVPEGHRVYHTCKVVSCVNPDHLVAMSMKEGKAQANVFRGKATKCIHGHEYTPENTSLYTDRDGRLRRYCRTCIRLRSKAKYRKRWTAR